MGLLMSVEVSIFINNRIDPTPNNISNLMTKLNALGKYEYLPNIINVQNIDLSNGKVNTVSNVAFSTTSNSSRITCTDDRIDCHLNFDYSNQPDLKESLTFCQKVLSTIMETFRIYGNRLAINIRQLSNSLPENIFDSKLGESMVSVFKFYQENQLSDWSTNANSKIDIKINDILEKTNVNTKLQAGMDYSDNSKIVICHLDINTLAKNKGYRFSSNDILPFIEETTPYIEQILNEFMVLDNE
ncbi:MAG: hypothetical protein U0L20_00030 [Ruminococcus sp.]|nr:hypothetical protein [Ruminococcus sp.]